MCRSSLKVELTIAPDFQWDEKVHGHSQVCVYLTLYTMKNMDQLLLTFFLINIIGVWCCDFDD